MGKCKFCGEDAGWFRSSHAECRNAHRQAQLDIEAFIPDAVRDTQSAAEIAAHVDELRATGHLQQNALEHAVLRGFSEAVDHFLDDDVLSKTEEDRLTEVIGELPVSEAARSQSASVHRLIRASLIRNLSEGEPLRHRMSTEGLPFLFQKSEEFIWAFPNVEYHENTVRTRYEGGSSGVSVRVMKGVYYRTGRFKGHKVQTEELVHKGTGVLALTTKHIYFHSSQRAFKVPYRKVVSLETYEDGLRVQRDGTTTKPQVFSGLDGWFASNIISQLN